MWLLRRQGDVALGAVCVLTVTFGAILIYVLGSLTALLLPFITTIKQLQSGTTESAPIAHWALPIACAIDYAMVLILIARKLKW